MRRIIILCLFVVLVLTLSAQQGEYQRKSVSSVQAVWINPGVQHSAGFNFDFFDKVVDHYIKVPRFDYNELEDAVVRDFINRANVLSVINETTLAEVMEQTVGKKIKEILSDPEIQAARRADLEDDSERVRLARVKGREFGLTEEMLMALMNSAYIYLPYITSIEKSYSDNKHSYEINGGILWYQVLISGDGNVRIEMRQSDKAKGIGTSDTKKANHYQRFRFGREVINTNPEEYAQLDAIQAWIRNLGVKMKQNPDFALSAQVVEKLPDNRYSAGLGLREGVHLDDGFLIVDLYQDNKGMTRAKTRGYSRIIQNADNISEENRNKRAVAQAFYGSTTEGGVLIENPRLGIDLKITMGYRTGMNIPIEASCNVLDNKEIFEDDVTESTEITATFSYNLAPIVGINQFFYDLDLAYGLPIAEYNPETTNSSAYTGSVYTGVSKKIWFGRQNLMLSGMLGYDRFVTSTSTLLYDNIGIAANLFGGKGGLDYEFMLSPNWKFTFGADYKFNFMYYSSSLIIDDEEYDISNEYIGGTPLSDYHEDINLGGLQIKVGISHALGQLPFNLFGWLDPLKKY